MRQLYHFSIFDNKMPRTALIAFAASVALAAAGSVCFQQSNGDPQICAQWTSSANQTTFTLTCNPDGSSLGNYLNWCAIAANPTQQKMIPAEVWMLLPDSYGNVRVENRLNVIHSIPNCAQTQVLQVLNSSVTVNPSTGAQVLQASWTRPRFLDPTLIAAGHVNLAGGANSGYLIAAAAQANYSNYQVCDNTTVQFHTYFNTGVNVNWDV